MRLTGSKTRRVDFVRALTKSNVQAGCCYQELRCKTIYMSCLHCSSSCGLMFWLRSRTFSIMPSNCLNCFSWQQHVSLRTPVCRVLKIKTNLLQKFKLIQFSLTRFGMCCLSLCSGAQKKKLLVYHQRFFTTFGYLWHPVKFFGIGLCCRCATVPAFLEGGCEHF